MEESKPKTKEQILHLLKTHGAQTATTLAQQMGVSSMAIRQHLQALKADALVTYHEEKRPLGRPVKLWALTDQSTGLFPDSHAELILDLIRSVKAVFGADGLARLVTERQQRQIQTYRVRLEELAQGEAWAEPWTSVVEAIAHLRSQEGYMAEVEPISTDEVLLVENHCPICTAAQACQGLCQAELEVFRAILGSTVSVERVEHLMQGDRRCAYRIQSA